TLPLLIVTGLPTLAFSWAGFVVPRTVIGGLKLVGKLLLPPDTKNRPPPPPFNLIGEVKLVWALLLLLPPKPNEGWEEPIVVKRSVSVSVRLLIWLTDLTFASSSVVRALFAWLSGLNPAGEIVIVLPTEPFTSLIFLLTA